MDKLAKLSVSLVKDKKLSNAKTVERLIDHSLSEETKGDNYDKRYKV
jgi:hypothetical protein